MRIIKNISSRKVYINDLRILLNPDESIDLDTNDKYVKNNGVSKDLEALISSGQLFVSQESKRESPLNVSKEELLTLMKELLTDMAVSEKQQKLLSTPLIESKEPAMSLDVDEINAQIHSSRQKQEDLKKSRISIEDTENDSKEDVGTEELVELLLKQKEGAKEVKGPKNPTLLY